MITNTVSSSSSSFLCPLILNNSVNRSLDNIHWYEIFKTIPNTIINCFIWAIVVLLIAFGIYIWEYIFRRKAKINDFYKAIQDYSLNECKSTIKLLFLRKCINLKIIELLTFLWDSYLFLFIIFLFVYSEIINPIIFDWFSHSKTISFLSSGLVSLIVIYFLKEFIKKLWNFIKSLLQDNGFYPNYEISDLLNKKGIIRKQLAHLKDIDTVHYKFDWLIFKSKHSENYFFTNNNQIDESSVNAIYNYAQKKLFYTCKNGKKAIKMDDITSDKISNFFSFTCDGKLKSINDILEKGKISKGVWKIVFNKNILMEKELISDDEKSELYKLIKHFHEILSR